MTARKRIFFKINLWALLLTVSICAVTKVQAATATSALACAELLSEERLTHRDRYYTNEELINAFESVQAYLNSKVIGQPALIENLMIALLVKGHVLLEGHPGAGKTLVARELGKSILGKNSRIQFTPDLMPGDITGGEQYNSQTGTKQFHPGPLFGNIILADEINRATPKTQSALLQAMEERTITVGNTTHELPETYLVIGTQNPHDGNGTFPLPEAQLDRFLFKIELDYPDYDTEMNIFFHNVKGARNDGPPPNNSSEPDLKPLTDSQLRAARAEVEVITIPDPVAKFMLTLVRATRNQVPQLQQFTKAFKSGAGTRATILLGRAAQARAWLYGRTEVTLDDIKALAPDVLAHRVAINDQMQTMDQNEPRILIQNLIERVSQLKL